ncbi:Citrate lyase subunit beta (plasmid) [Variovorax sp. SRS16]|uniref:HpcH/HpaI aldolase/citrate lyase family protein n=1 Tax=Variovorax sp. SRS16 TaxID=282217 RepID=UPI001317D040|nr:CoA ester lyase [Variovorax sp. SRS16]VTU46429.1 Citrate lyase subunit beta [Variovorax sp. SRS16]
MRSKLFVPASRPELFAKALASEADALSFDLEDAVEESRKQEAREQLAAFLDGAASKRGAKRIVVRVNGFGTRHFAQDLEAVVRPGLDILNLPMTEDAEQIVRAAAVLERLERARGISRPIGILANIESPRALRMAREIAMAHSRVIGLQIGYGDLLAPLGISSSEPFATQAVRFAVRMAAGEAGVDAYDGAYVAIDDPNGYRRDALAARQLGFAGKSCIHPSQVALANDVFRPSEADVAHAARVVEAARASLARGVGAFVVDGRLVDGPFITRAEKLVELARRLGMPA